MLCKYKSLNHKDLDLTLVDYVWLFFVAGAASSVVAVFSNSVAVILTY